MCAIGCVVSTHTERPEAASTIVAARLMRVPRSSVGARRNSAVASSACSLASSRSSSRTKLSSKPPNEAVAKAAAKPPGFVRSYTEPATGSTRPEGSTSGISRRREAASSTSWRTTEPDASPARLKYE